jgi:hypothetical protein
LRQSTLAKLLVFLPGSLLASMVAVFDFLTARASLETRLVAATVVANYMVGGLALLILSNRSLVSSHASSELLVDHRLNVWNGGDEGESDTNGKFGDIFVAAGHLLCISSQTTIADRGLDGTRLVLAVGAMLPRAAAFGESGYETLPKFHVFLAGSNLKASLVVVADSHLPEETCGIGNEEAVQEDRTRVPVVTKTVRDDTEHVCIVVPYDVQAGLIARTICVNFRTCQRDFSDYSFQLDHTWH